MVIGPTDSGKSSLAKMLLSWSAKRGWKPTFVDLDVGQGAITIPGCISATPIEMPIDPIEGIPLEMPIVYFYGHASPRYLRVCGLVVVMIKVVFCAIYYLIIDMH